MYALDDTITRLRKVIKQHRDILTAYEALTRSALVDPMLTALGWDVTDLGVVRPEHPVPSRGKSTDHTDYALFVKPQKISAIIEAKRLDAPDRDLKDAHQSASYKAGRLGAPYFVITDGDCWEMYSKEAEKDPVMKFRLTHGTRTELYHEVLCLWRKSLGKRLFSISAQPAKAQPAKAQLAKPPIIDPFSKPIPRTSHQLHPPSSSQEWVPLTEWETIWLSNKSRAQPNLTVRLPDRTKYNARTWRDAARIVINFLDREGLLRNLEKSPLKKGSKQLFANTKPMHDTNRKFRGRPTITSDGLCFNLDLSTSVLMQATIILLENTKQNPANIKLKTESKSATPRANS